MTVADVNADRRPDLIIPSHNNDHVLVLQNDGSYQFKVRSIAVGRHPIAVAALDLTDDGLPELAVLNAADNTLQVLINRGDSGFVGGAVNTIVTGAQPVALAAGDLNNDGKSDLVVVHRESGLVKLLFAP
ncbi:MAG: VCBS repeat-containing protein [Polyangia bacterium]